MTPKQVLLIEDDARSALSLERLLRSNGYDVFVTHDGSQGLDRALGEGVDVVITDLRLPGMGGLELVQRLHDAKPRLPVVLMTAFGTTETAIEATKRGAFDYLVKPFDIGEMLQVIGRAAASGRLMKGPIELGEYHSEGPAIIGSSRPMRELYKEIGRVASKPITVLIRGETGTGKELVARALYQHSDRASNSFIAVNCAAIPETLLESELFGHERGAFTGAEQRRIGRFEQAIGGTLFLDEIGDMSPVTQAKLLRVLQERCIQRLGGNEPIPVDVRIIAATHCDLETAISEGRFREDLFYRLSSVVIKLPALRDRCHDVPELIQYFLHRFAKQLRVNNASVEEDAVQWLRTQPWPGNVRQLENVLRQGLLVGRGLPIRIEHLLGAISGPPDSASVGAKTFDTYIDELLASARAGSETDVYAKVLQAVEQKLFGRAIELAQGNQAKAARWLNISRQTMREKLQTFGLREPPE